MKKYDHSKIEKKWQKEWAKKKIFEAENPRQSALSQRESAIKPKFYGLIEFPYPSGDGLHVGHIRSNTAMDIISRKRWMEGYNVLYPIGWDAFGLPTENYAIKNGIQPVKVTKTNTDIFRKQLQSLGFSFDWSREINTTDPKYYKWTQWIFLQMFKAGLAYKKKMAINWCPKDKIGLANEEVINGCCERCGTPVEKREKEQWMLAITKYAQRLYDDLDSVDYLEPIKLQQRNWIGPSVGAEVRFKIQDSRIRNEIGEVKIFTTRADTLFGVTYLVLSPEHPLIQNLESRITNYEEVKKYIEASKKKADIERTDIKKEKTGVELSGVKAINPANDEEVPIWIADYILADYGTGAIMAVPAHDERDFEFAKKYNLPIKFVIEPPATEFGDNQDNAYMGFGYLQESGKFDGMDSEEAKKKITEFVGGKIVTTYKLRDWVFSRQRYWGEPIPLIFCEACAKKLKESQTDAEGEELNPGWIPVPEKDLPVKLPEIKNYQPTDTGESPLAGISKWVNVKCPQCGGLAKRETDTMPNWAGSSWYYLAYLFDKKGFDNPVSIENWKLKIENFRHFMPVDWYNGGMEHTTLHLLYSRFWHKFLYDQKLVPTSEPYKKRTSHGLILAKGGEKMSKSKGNVVNPDDIVKLYGADSLRLYEMFMGPFDQAIPWSTESIIGVRRFLEKVWKVSRTVLDIKLIELRIKNKELKKDDSEIIIHNSKFLILLNRTIQKVSEDIEAMKFNTAISAMMILVNEFENRIKNKELRVKREDFETFLKILSPFAPHIAEEIWQELGHKNSIALEHWPVADEEKMQEKEINIVVQVNGKVRSQITISNNAGEEAVLTKIKESENVAKWIVGREIKKVIYVKNRLINIVI